MRHASFLPIAILTALSVNGFAQSSQSSATGSTKDTAQKHGPLPSIMAGLGVLYFNGNIGKGNGITAYSTVRGGYTLAIEERPVSFLGIQLDGMIGKLSASERSNNPDSNLNFQSNVVQGEITLNLHFDGLLLKKDAPIAPYIYTGFSYMSYSKYADLKDAAGDPYFYWTDGTIRNDAQNAQNIYQATIKNNIVQRDYNYETFVSSGSTECVPVGLGVKVKITENLAMNVQAAYYFTFTNSLEVFNQVANAPLKNDKYLFSFATIEYHFTHKNANNIDETKYPDFTVFKSLTVEDTVKKTDEISKEKSDELEAKQMNRDTNAVDRSAAFNEHPTETVLKEEDKENQAKKHDPNTVPPRFRPADKNHDGYISSQEITQAIDEFFDGTSTMTIADINGLIDYFFDQ